MFSSKDFKPKKTPSGHVQAGTYRAEIVDILDNPKYVEGDAFIIKYQLSKNDNSFVADFEETFFNTLSNARTRALATLMKKFGIDTVEGLIGKRITVDIRFKVGDHGNKLPTIISREPLSEDSVSSSSPCNEVL
jgi:hypothetical protein